MKTLRKIDIYTIPLLFVCIASAVLRSFALLTSFNTVTMHFDEKVAITVGNILVAVAVIGFLSYLIFGEKEQPLIARSDNAATYIPAGIVSTALLFMAAECVKKVISTGYMQPPVSYLYIASAALAVLSAASFFLSVFIERRDNLFKAVFSLSIVIFLAVYSALLYFNKQVHPTNSPNRFIDEMAYLSAAIFFLFEARIPLGRAKWRGNVAFGLTATLMCCYSAIPSLVMYFANGYILSESLAESILTLTIALLIGSKVMQIKRLIPDAECDIAKSISQMASIREEEIRDLHEHPHARDNDIKEENDGEDAANYTFDIPEAEAVKTNDDAEDSNSDNN